MCHLAIAIISIRVCPHSKFQMHKVIMRTLATLHIDKSVKPVTQKPRRIPFHLRQKTEAELQRLENLGIIEDAEGPTPWVSQLVVRNKPKNPDEVRICIDMRDGNKAITREKHPIYSANST